MYIKYLQLKETPLFRIVILYILGTLIGSTYPSYSLHIFCLFAVLIVVTAVIYWRQSLDTLSTITYQFYISLSIFVCILLTAYTLGSSARQDFQLNHYINSGDLQLINKYQIKILSPLEVKSKSIKFEGQIQALLYEDSTLPLRGQIVCYIEKDSVHNDLSINDIIIANVKLQIIAPPKNPKEFNYKNYLANQGIYASTYIGRDKWYRLSKSNSNDFSAVIHSCRDYLSQHIITYIKAEREAQIALAILVGEKSYLDFETKRIYANSGAMHILAVSGLHVGIVYLLFNYLLFFLNGKKTAWLKPPILILLLWIYALISGGSPSVLRATTMFSFIAMGQALKRYVNIYNMLAASALVLIVMNPLIIYELGFQLSYAAVLGILYFHKKIYALITTSNYILDKMWSLSAVSIAAQLSTLPLSLLYFHQFPNLFLFSNLIVIPAAILIVYLGMILLLLSFSPFLSSIVAFLLENLIYGLNEFIALIDSFPYATSTNIHFTIIACLMAYIVLGSISLSLIYRKKAFLSFSLVLILLSLGYFNYEKISSSNGKSFSVYNIKNHSAIEFKNGLEIHNFLDSFLRMDSKKMSYHITPNQTTYMSNDIVYHENLKDYQLFSFANKTFLIVYEQFEIPQKVMTLDYAIICQQNKLYLQNLHEKIKAKKYIFDSSNDANQYYYWKKDCESLNLDCYFVSDSFAYEEKLF